MAMTPIREIWDLARQPANGRAGAAPVSQARAGAPHPALSPTAHKARRTLSRGEGCVDAALLIPHSLGSAGASPSLEHLPSLRASVVNAPPHSSRLHGEISSPIPHSRAAFTSLQLVAAIGVVVVLAAALVWGGLRMFSAPKPNETLVEIAELGKALEEYKTAHGEYPPSLGVFVGDMLVPVATSAFPNEQKDRVERHLRRAFRGYTGTYQSFKEDIALATQPSAHSATPTLDDSVMYTSGLAGVKQGGLNANYLDPAESLVLWLGGLPDPKSDTRLAGFHRDPASPFVDPAARATGVNSQDKKIHEAPLSEQGQRTRPLFAFDPARLVDYDADGWPEYLPPGGTIEDETPPYVYFDSQSYDKGPAYPYPSVVREEVGYPTPTIHESAHGNAIPYAADPQPKTDERVKFVNPASYQIIAAGPDCAYSDRLYGFKEAVPGPPASAPAPWWFVPSYYPSGTNFKPQERDNLTNFAPGALGENLPE